MFNPGKNYDKSASYVNWFISLIVNLTELLFFPNEHNMLELTFANSAVKHMCTLQSYCYVIQHNSNMI